jgi:hypothetical protein
MQAFLQVNFLQENLFIDLYLLFERKIFLDFYIVLWVTG